MAEQFERHYAEKEWKVEVEESCQTQTNSFDCGVFSCLFAKYLYFDVPFHFGQNVMETARKMIAYEIKETCIISPVQ